MAFDARNLRVQLPCGPVTVFPCRFETDYCFQYTHITCLWGSCRLWSACPYGSCIDSPLTCRWGSPPICGPGSPYVEGTPQLCAGSETIQQVSHVSVEDLGVLRERLQAQLKEVEAAEKKVQQYEKEQG